MIKKLFYLPIFFIALIACNDKGNGNNPFDNPNTKRNKDDNNRYKDDNKDDFPNNRDYGMDRDYEDDESSSSKSIVGKWTVMEMRMGDGGEVSVEESEKAYGSSIRFMNDGTYESYDSGETESSESGEYTYNKRTKELTVTSDKGGEENVCTVSWKGNKMVMTFETGASIILRKM